MQEQVDVQTAIARLWSELAAVNARLETPPAEQAHGRFTSCAELSRLYKGARVSRMAADALWQAYIRLLHVAETVRLHLHRECDHACYQGSPYAVDALVAELKDARMRWTPLLRS